MYDFIEINQQGENNLSSMAITYDGVLFDEAIPGFSVLHVTGRETVNIEVESVGVDVGFIPIHQRMDSPPIKVEYIIRAKDEPELKRAYSLLMNNLIKTEDVPFSFADEEATYYGRYTTHNDIDTRNLHVVGEFELFRPKPHKLSDFIETDGTIPSGMRGLKLSRIELTVTQSTNNLTLTNGTFNVRLLENFSIGDKIVIDFEKYDVFKGSQSILYALALDSDFENFDINQGGTITSAQASVKIFIRERWV